MVGMSKAKPELKPLPKRFYAAATVQQNAQEFGIHLDGKPIKTPQQKLLQTSSQSLAQKIAAEWEAQAESINTDTMPLTRLLTITLDRVGEDRAALLTDIAGYCDTDLLFYREPTVIGQGGGGDIGAAAHELALLQQKHFTPILDWCDKTYGMVFRLAEGVMPVVQPPETLARLQEVFAATSDAELAALAMLVPLLGSALLALAVWNGAIDIEEALIAARLDEAVQAKHWGEDPELVAKWADKCRDARAAAFFLTAN